MYASAMFHSDEMLSVYLDLSLSRFDCLANFSLVRDYFNLCKYSNGGLHLSFGLFY